MNSENLKSSAETHSFNHFKSKVIIEHLQYAMYHDKHKKKHLKGLNKKYFLLRFANFKSIQHSLI